MIPIHSYTVEAGDTLSGIAVKLYGESHMYWDIAQHNGIGNPNKISVGQVLDLPKPAYDKTLISVPVVPTEKSLNAIANLFKDGFCDDRMAYDIYAAALGVESQYYASVGAVRVK